MDQQEFNGRLSAITTQWNLLRRAHTGVGDATQQARQELIGRYIGAVYRYLLAAVRNTATADDLTQEFALRFLQGRFRNACPQRGRFRDYVKTCLFHLVDDHFNRLKRGPTSVALQDAPEAAQPSEPEIRHDEVFLQSWRRELLARTWAALWENQQQTAQPYYSVLKLRVDHPDLSSAEIAERLSVVLGRPIVANHVRQLVHRARTRFGEILVQEVAHSLETDSPEKVAEELDDIDLLKYCRHILQRRRGTAGSGKDG